MNSISIKTNSLDETESEADAKKKKPLRMLMIIMMIMIPILCIVVFWMFSIVAGSFSSKEDASREANKRQATIQLTDK